MNGEYSTARCEAHFQQPSKAPGMIWLSARERVKKSKQLTQSRQGAKTREGEVLSYLCVRCDLA
jgi:hypothetical protein